MDALLKLLGRFIAKPNAAERYIIANNPKNVGDVERLQYEFQRNINTHRGLL